MDLLPLSPSSRLLSKTTPDQEAYLFYFDIDARSGALLFLPHNDSGYLNAIRNGKHREPEIHIGDIALKLTESWKLINQGAEPKKIVGVTDKDRSLLDVLQNNFDNICESKIIWPDMHPIETLELLSNKVENNCFGDIDILVCRHLLEHSRNVHEFIKSLSKLLSTSGLCLIEVPDSTELYENGDLSQLWEEHCIYLTKPQLLLALQAGGFDIIDIWSKCSEGEMLHIVIAKPSCSAIPAVDLLEDNIDRQKIINDIHIQIIRVRSRVKRCKTSHQLCIFGANHVASTFLDLIGAASNADITVLDDDMTKSGLTISLARILVSHPSYFNAERKVHFLVAVHEGRYPELYERLRSKYPESNGHRVESLKDFVKCGN